MQTTLEIRVLPFTDLRPAPYNPRRLPQPGDSAYEKLAASLREFGLVEPLIWNEITGHIVGGHLRLTILRQLGAVTVPVAVVRLDQAREKALNVILNNREAQGRFDPAKLTTLLTELEQLPELAMTGFDARDLAALQFQPADHIETQESRTAIEITLTIAPDQFDAVAPRLDALVAEFELRCHIRR